MGMGLHWHAYHEMIFIALLDIKPIYMYNELYKWNTCIRIIQIKLFSLLHTHASFLKHIFLYKNPIVPTEPVFGSFPFFQNSLAGIHRGKARVRV